MVVIILTNAQLGLSYFEKNGILGSYYSQNLKLSSGFLISKGPIFSVALKANKVEQNHQVLLGSRNWGKINVLLKGEGGNSGGIIEKEFEFKRSFDDYLKTMESVKSVREKRKKDKHSSNGENPRNGEQNGKFEDSKAEIPNTKPKLLEQEKESGRLKVERKMRFEEKSNSGSAPGLVQNELDSKQSGVDVRVKSKLGMEAENGRNNGTNSVREVRRYEGDRYRENKGHQTLKRDHFEGGKDTYEGDRFRENKGQQIIRRDRFQGEKIYARNELQNVKRGRVDKRYIEDSSDDEIEKERAAFKSLGEDNDICDKPRVSRMDMEERIQKLAKW